MANLAGIVTCMSQGQVHVPVPFGLYHRVHQGVEADSGPMPACLPVLAVTFMTLGIFMKRSMEATQKNYATGMYPYVCHQSCGTSLIYCGCRGSGWGC